jgi:hypothetical protein
MDFAPEKLKELRELLQAINVTDDHLARGVRLTASGTEKVAKRFGITTEDVPAMLAAVSKVTAEDIKEDNERFSYEADYMGNLTLRDSETGKDVFMQGDEAFQLAAKLEAHPDQREIFISQYFDQEPLQESQVVAAIPPMSGAGGTVNMPYKGKFATLRFWSDDGHQNHVKLISLRDDEDKETEITADLKAHIEAQAMRWALEGKF